MSPPSSENLRKAAMVVAALGEELAVEVCSHLPMGEVLALGQEISKLQQVPAT